ncbi:MAG: flagellar export protein FliJ [Pseudomonadota bacterium]
MRKVLDDVERERMQAMANAQRRVTEAEAKLQELARYHVDYAASFSKVATKGLMSTSLRDFQVFLSRLAEAQRQQERIVARAREDLGAETHRWQNAAQRSKALAVVVDRWTGEERRQDERRDQLETDDRAQRMSRGARVQR